MAECIWDREAFMKKVALVTGGANGIGKGIVKKFLSEGYDVAVADFDEENGCKLEQEQIGENCSVEFIKTDITNDQDVENLFQHVFNKYQQIDTVVCDAGIQIRDWAIDFSMEKFDYLMNVNLRGYYLCAKIAARYMKEQETGGTIVCISSVNSLQYHSKRSPYNISKAAINGMVGTLGVEWGRYNIRINAVAPGYVYTEVMQSGLREGIIDEENIMKVIPMKRYISVEEIANVVYFMASDMSSGVTGQVLCVDGGWSKNALPEDKDM